MTRDKYINKRPPGNGREEGVRHVTQCESRPGGRLVVVLFALPTSLFTVVNLRYSSICATMSNKYPVQVRMREMSKQEEILLKRKREIERKMKEQQHGNVKAAVTNPPLPKKSAQIVPVSSIPRSVLVLSSVWFWSRGVTPLELSLWFNSYIEGNVLCLVLYLCKVRS